MFVYKNHTGVGYYCSTLLVSKHAFSTREGGESTCPYTCGLNLAFGRGDDDATVLQNLQTFANAVGFDAGKCFCRKNETHSSFRG